MLQWRQVPKTSPTQARGDPFPSQLGLFSAALTACHGLGHLQRFTSLEVLEARRSGVERPASPETFSVVT